MAAAPRGMNRKKKKKKKKRKERKEKKERKTNYKEKNKIWTNKENGLIYA